MNDDLLIIRTNTFLSREDLKKFRESIVQQRKQPRNVIVLPYWCDVIREPNDVEIKVKEKSQGW